MAIYHLSVKTFSRSKGQSATAAIAYRAGEKIKCEHEGRTHDYTKKNDVLHSEIFLPANAPSWATDRQQLWNEVEKAEKRKNSTIAREFEVALP
ncbi:MobA/MobL family protein, partial [Psychrobacter sp. CAL346-MNA-CIBAN-0220]|uniref:MobA/MobL family protein n=1 Tax=Psychrobacter sp. CAL346-MNA-CIBAN-0220 TaxID=3140457 RepID=UPI0033168FFD